jgi:hypothetical protein
VLVDSIQAAFKVDSIPMCDSTKLIFTSNSYAYFGVRSYEWVIDHNYNNIYTGSTGSAELKTTKQYNLSLTVTGNSGCTSQTQQDIKVYIHQTPADSVLINPLACAGKNVYFSATNALENEPVQYNWIFGNGDSKIGQNVSSVFSPAGTYTYTLFATTNFGCSDTVAGTVTIKTTPRLTITPVDTVMEPGWRTKLC